MLLITVDDVISSMGLSTGLKNDLSATITSTIEKAQVLLSTDLGSSLSLLTCEDRVHLNTDLFSGVTQNGMLKVKLTNLFVDKDSVRVVVTSSLGVPGEKVKPLHINDVQGELFFPLELDGKFLTINYDSGLDSKTVPGDVKAALLLFTARVFATQQPNTSDAAPAKSTDDLASTSILHYKRVSSFAFRPFSHTSEA